MRFSLIDHSICDILGMIGTVDVNQRNLIPRTRTEVSPGEPKGNESTGCYADQGTFTLTFDLEFSRSHCIQGMKLKGQIWNLLYLRQKWFDCRETKSKHIDWALGLKWDHQLWLWPWHWPWLFKVKYGICYISAQKDPITTIRKASISIEPQASNVTMILKGEV